MWVGKVIGTQNNRHVSRVNEESVIPGNAQPPGGCLKNEMTNASKEYNDARTPNESQSR